MADTPGLRTVEDLKTTKIVRKKKEFPSKAGEFPDPDEVRNAINELAAVQTGLPAFAAELFNLGANQPLPDVSESKSYFQTAAKTVLKHQAPLSRVLPNLNVYITCCGQQQTFLGLVKCLSVSI